MKNYKIINESNIPKNSNIPYLNFPNGGHLNWGKRKNSWQRFFSSGDSNGDPDELRN